MPSTPPTDVLETDEGPLHFVDIRGAAGGRLDRLPWSLRVLMENVLRTSESGVDEAQAIAEWTGKASPDREVTFRPGRILMHDTTCVPALVDIAAMRDVLAEANADPAALDPVVPVHAVIDHSVAVDRFGSASAMAHNMTREIERNAERYRFMKWAAGALGNFTLFPPGVGILHTVNLEHLASVVAVEQGEDRRWAVPDTLIGTDSHTPMINALGILGWGVGGIEAESVMFGVPMTLSIPDVIGVRLRGALPEGTLATDLALQVTERLRSIGAVDAFVEFFGPGVGALSVGERAVVANMAPEYGATVGYFPIDARTLDYLRATGRDRSHVSRVETYARRQGLWFDAEAVPAYGTVVDIDLSTLRPAMAGPRRPQDRIEPSQVAPLLAQQFSGRADAPHAGRMCDGAVAIAAITSCTNTTDPKLLVAAGLVARKARRLGLRPPPHVKTSFAPGSGAVLTTLRRANLLDDLDAVGFSVVGIGCTTCIGNSGPLVPEMAEAIAHDGVRAVAVLSGNRNFPGRIHPAIDLAFLASPPLVVAYAIAGHANLDITADEIARTPDGKSVRLSGLWPTNAEVDALYAGAARPDDTIAYYAHKAASRAWEEIEAPPGALFRWDERSTYLRRPPFAAAATTTSDELRIAAAPLIVLGDDVTTDHISPAGQIPRVSEAGRYLIDAGDDPHDLNVYAARRGNFEVMVRGLFANPAVRNLLCPDSPAGTTVHGPGGDVVPLAEAARRCRERGLAPVIIAGERYGTGSSRDWAAKGPALLGVRAVIAASFERIHRSNLIGMGILPLRLPPGTTPERLGLKAADYIEIAVPGDELRPGGTARLDIQRAVGGTETMQATLDLRTAQEVSLIRAGGVMPFMLARAHCHSSSPPARVLS